VKITYADEAKNGEKHLQPLQESIDKFESIMERFETLDTPPIKSIEIGGVRYIKSTGHITDALTYYKNNALDKHDKQMTRITSIVECNPRKNWNIQCQRPNY